MLEPFHRHITAALSTSLFLAAASPAVAHAAWTTATPSHPKLSGNPTRAHAGVTKLVPLTAVPPAPPTPHLTSSFLYSGSSTTSSGSGTVVSGALNVSAINIDNGTLVSGTLGSGSLNLAGGSFNSAGIITSSTLNLPLTLPSDDHAITLLIDGTPTSGILEPVYGANGSGITGITFVPVTLSPTLGGVLTVSAGSSTLTLTPPSATGGTLTIDDGVTINPPSLDLNGPIVLLNGQTLTLSSGSFVPSASGSAVVITPEPASLALLALAAPLLLKRRRA